jgi:hypothetical protein
VPPLNFLPCFAAYDFALTFFTVPFEVFLPEPEPDFAVRPGLDEDLENDFPVDTGLDMDGL